MNYTIEVLNKDDYGLLRRFIYEAIFVEEGEEQPLLNIIDTKEISVYIDGFGGRNDNGLVARQNRIVIGMVWTRILNGNVKGFGNIDEYTSEFAISVLKDYRACGVGYSLMKEMLKTLKVKGYEKASLAVQKKNYAHQLYEKIGFKVIGENHKEYIMLYDLIND